MLRDKLKETGKGTGMPNPRARCLRWGPIYRCAMSSETFRHKWNGTQSPGHTRRLRLPCMPRCYRRTDKEHVHLRTTEIDASRRNGKNSILAYLRRLFNVVRY